MSLNELAVATLGLFLVISWLYRQLFPKPIPGIPYKKRSAKRLFGDIPDALQWRKQTGEMWSYIRSVALELNTPIFQMFMRGPFGRPWVIIADFRESQDIQSSRQGEFDRSAFLGDVFGPLLPGNHVWMPSNDEFRAHRNLIRDTMSPAFLRDTVAPVIHLSMQDMLKLWREKIRLAQGKSFQVDKDLIRAVVDLILSATLGIQATLSRSQADLISEINQIDVPADKDMPAIFPSGAESPTYTAIRRLVDSIQIGMTSPAPKLHMKIALQFYPSLISARKYTDKLMTQVLQSAWERISSRAEEEVEVTSAVDLLVRREVQTATKQNREIMYDTQVIRDELFGFYLAGHETTSTTLCWAVKHLTKHQDAQEKLRAALKSAHMQAVREKRLPTAQEIVDTDVPYLDAFIEENHRLGQAIPTVIRRATRDAVVLGHMIPKGTDVFMIMNGPSFQRLAFPVDEMKRSESSRMFKNRYGLWDASNIEDFIPERFLIQDESGVEKFNPFAGPVLPYGAGLRSCFGIKLGILELRVIITMITWSFELQPTPPSLSSFQGQDVNTHRAQQTYLRLVEVEE